MKKVLTNACRMLMASAVAIVMLTGMKSAAHAANDTVVIDFSKQKTQSYMRGQQITSPDWDHIEDFNLNEEEKNVVFLSTMVQLYDLFPVDYTCQNCNNNKGRIIVNKDAKQFIDFETSCKGIKCDAGDSKGTFEMTVTSKFLEGKSKSWIDAQMPFFAAKKLYGVEAKDSKGANYFKLKIVFNNPESQHVKQDENGKVQTENKDQNKDQKQENKQNVEADFVIDGYAYKITGNKEVTFTGLTDASIKKVVIPDTVNYKGNVYKVTAIADKALYHNKKVKKVYIGENVTKIGDSAFAKCKKLKKVKIYTTSLEKIGKKAFYKNSKTLTVKVPKAQIKAYKKLLKKAGMKSVDVEKK